MKVLLPDSSLLWTCDILLLIGKWNTPLLSLNFTLHSTQMSDQVLNIYTGLCMFFSHELLKGTSSNSYAHFKVTLNAVPVMKKLPWWPSVSVTATMMQMIWLLQSDTPLYHKSFLWCNTIRTKKRRVQFRIMSRPVQASTKRLFNQLCNYHEKWGEASSCWDHMPSSRITGTTSNIQRSVFPRNSAYWIPLRQFAIRLRSV